MPTSCKALQYASKCTLSKSDRLESRDFELVNLWITPAQVACRKQVSAVYDAERMAIVQEQNDNTHEQ